MGANGGPYSNYHNRAADWALQLTTSAIAWSSMWFNELPFGAVSAG